MIQYILSLFKKSVVEQPLLGRWSRENNKVRILKSYFADIDNCGIYQYSKVKNNTSNLKLRNFS